MKVSLVDVDSKIPNLALMKISAHHKALARWCNNKFIFKSCPRFEDYEGAKKLAERGE